MIWDDKILDELNKNEFRKFCDPFKKNNQGENPKYLIVFVFVPIILKKS